MTDHRHDVGVPYSLVEEATDPDGGPETAPLVPEKVSDQIDRWLASDGDKTLGGLIDVFQAKSFALIFILLLGVPALPLPTGGATHVFEIMAMLVALQLVAGRDKIWLPKRWCKVELGTGGGRTKFINGLMKSIRWIERCSLCGTSRA